MGNAGISLPIIAANGLSAVFPHPARSKTLWSFGLMRRLRAARFSSDAARTHEGFSSRFVGPAPSRQPGKLCVQQGDGLGSGWWEFGPQGDGDGFGGRNQSAAGSLVAKSTRQKMVISPQLSATAE